MHLTLIETLTLHRNCDASEKLTSSQVNGTAGQESLPVPQDQQGRAGGGPMAETFPRFGQQVSLFEQVNLWTSNLLSEECSLPVLWVLQIIGRYILALCVVRDS